MPRKEKNIMSNGAAEIGSPTNSAPGGGKPISPGARACRPLRGRWSPTRPASRAIIVTAARGFAEEACHADRPEPHHRSGPRQEGRGAVLRSYFWLEVRTRWLLCAGARERSDDAAVRRQRRVRKPSLRFSRERRRIRCHLQPSEGGGARLRKR